MTIEVLTSERSLNTATVTLACIDHHSAKTVITCHHRQLLVLYLHIECTEIQMNRILKEIEMGSQLVVPTHFRFIRDRLIHLLIILSRMRNIIITTHRSLTVGIQFCLKNIAEHLDVITTSTITLADYRIHITAMGIQSPSESQLRQQLFEMIVRATIEHTAQSISCLPAHHVRLHSHIGRTFVMNGGKHIIISQTQGKGKRRR